MGAERLERTFEVLKAHSDTFVRAYIFGSVARGDDDKWSDVDVVLVRDTSLDFFHRVTEVSDLVARLSPVDLLIYTSEEFASMKLSNDFIRSIVREGVLVEGQQNRSEPLAHAKHG